METRFTFDNLNAELIGMFNTRGQRVQEAGQAGVRSSTGHRLYWKTTPPTDAAREAARKATADIKNLWHFADCPCCGVSYMIPSEYVSIREHGVCRGCKLFLDGQFEGVVAFRMPTLVEALEAPPTAIRQAEAQVIREELVRRTEKGDGQCLICRSCGGQIKKRPRGVAVCTCAVPLA